MVTQLRPGPHTATFNMTKEYNSNIEKCGSRAGGDVKHYVQKISYPKDRVNQTAASFSVLSFTGYVKHLIKVNQIYFKREKIFTWFYINTHKDSV